jgi:undecaprenyl diphosphate synthase
MVDTSKIDLNKIPKHIAITMDGNGRWAKTQGENRIYGHLNAITAVSETVEMAAEIGVKYLTLYAFSTENWNRPKEEVDALMGLLVKTLKNEVKKLNDNQIKLATIGDTKSLPKETYDELMHTIGLTSQNTKMTVVIALSYSSKWEIIEAVKQIAEEVKNNSISINDINENIFSSHLTTAGIPDPDILIRTSGEKRISNFLLWQIAYSELYFTDKLWPDFRKQDLVDAILDYQQRERRYGLTSEQLSN